MSNEYIRNAFKSLEDLKVVIEPVKMPLLQEDVEAEPIEDSSEKTVSDLLTAAGSYLTTQEFDIDGTKYVMFMEGLHDGESCDILFDEFDISNVNEVLFEILDEEHDFIDSLHATEFGVDSKFSDVTKAAAAQLQGEPGLEDDAEAEDEDEKEEHDKNVRDFVGDEAPAEDGEELPPVEVEMEPANIEDAPEEEPLGEAEGERKFIKTRNSCVDASDLADELEAQGIGYKFEDDGLSVEAKDYTKAMGILDNLESQCEESLDESQKFNLQDEQEVKKADEILNKDEGEAIEQIVDASAETIDDLQKTYIGSIILQCPTCKTMIYKNPDQLVKDTEAEEDIYNVDEECPHCGAKDGFELIGQVASLSVNPDGEPAPEEKPEEEPAPEEPEEKPEPVSPMPELTKEEPEPEEHKTFGEALEEDTVKKGKKWVNKGKEGEHGEFKTKKEADAQRKAMFANGYREDCKGKDCEVKLESFDEVKYDRLISRYLRESYSNVKAYKTTAADIDDGANKIIIEGVITFKSGKEKSTKFVFEAKEITKKNQIKFVGINEAFSPSRAYTLLGQIQNNKLVSESLSYRYNVDGKQVKGKIEPLRKR